MGTLLSIIVPVYNAEEFLKICIESTIAAIDDNTEIILVNDGSADKSGDICDEYSEKDSRIKVIHQENKGVTAARKNGFKAAGGEYITFVDSDDWIEKDIYKEAISIIKEKGAEIVVCDMVRETENGQLKVLNHIDEGFYNKEKLKKSFYPFMLFDFDMGVPGVIPSLCNKVIKRELIENVIFCVDETVVFGEDALCSYPIMLDASSIYVLRKELYHYRENYRSVTSIYDEKLLKKFMVLYEEMKRMFSERGFDFQEQLNGYMARFSLSCIRKELILNKKKTVRERIRIVKEYAADSRVENAFKSSINRIKDKRITIKMRMINRKQFFLLYLSFMIKETVMRLRMKK